MKNNSNFELRVIALACLSGILRDYFQLPFQFSFLVFSFFVRVSARSRSCVTIRSVEILIALIPSVTTRLDSKGSKTCEIFIRRGSRSTPVIIKF